MGHAYAYLSLFPVHFWVVFLEPRVTKNDVMQHHVETGKYKNVVASNTLFPLPSLNLIPACFVTTIPNQRHERVLS